MTATIASTRPDDGDVRPVVAAKKSSNAAVWLFGGVLLVGAIVLFTALSERRAALTAPATTVAMPQGTTQISSPPELALPAQRQAYPRVLRPAPQLTRPDPAPVRLRTIPTPAPIAQPRPVIQPQQIDAPIYDEPLRQPPIYDARSALPSPPLASPASQSENSDRVSAQRFANPATTVPKGTIIPAVLETALDSTRPGAVRAITSRHVRSFDGSRILVPRGSRIYGDYSAELAPGQKRALIRWTRLIRPDGVTIALDSPAADPLGRAGVKGKVNSHFFQRFGGAILQSVLDIGVGAATRQVGGDQVIVALPGSNPQVSSQTSQQIVPTLKVKHGTSVSVFVAKDLDFTAVEQ